MNLSEMLCRYQLLHCSHNASQQALLQKTSNDHTPVGVCRSSWARRLLLL